MTHNQEDLQLLVDCVMALSDEYETIVDQLRKTGKIKSLKMIDRSGWPRELYREHLGFLAASMVKARMDVDPDWVLDEVGGGNPAAAAKYLVNKTIDDLEVDNGPLEKAGYRFEGTRWVFRG